MGSLRWIVIPVSLICLSSFFAGVAAAAETDRQVLSDLLTELEQKIEDGDRRMVAHPKYIEELRALVKQYRAKLRVVFLRDDFSDGDYWYNPTWVVDSGTFNITSARRLSSEITADQPASSQAPAEKTSPLGSVLRDILQAPAEESKREPASTRVKEARIRTAVQIAPAFEVDLTLVSRSTRGTMQIVLLGGDQAVPQYRMVYQAAPSQDRPIQIYREREGRSYLIEVANQYPALDDGIPHKMQWIRDTQGRMRVLVDGKEVLSTYEIYYRDNFSGLALVNRNGSYEWGPIAVYQAQETKSP